jgi:hypothetical protein
MRCGKREARWLTAFGRLCGWCRRHYMLKQRSRDKLNRKL